MSAAAELPFDAVIFDMDGVVTRTARLHAAAWKELFDDFLRRRAAGGEEPFRPFDENADYRAYVDGQTRLDGVRGFLASRDIRVPEGDPGDPPSAQTVHALAKRKDAMFARRLREQGVGLFDTTVALIDAMRAHGVKTGIVTSSRHGRDVLAAAGVEDRFDARVDGIDIDELGLPGKPAPDAFVECATRLGTAPAHAVVVEDASAGVAAGRAGGFGLVVGVDRDHNRDALAEHGADIVVGDLGELDAAAMAERFTNARQRASWQIEQEGFDPARERDVESLFTVANGYVGVRGALDMPLPFSQGDLFIAGIYDRKIAAQPYSEEEFLEAAPDDYPYGQIVSFPFPFRLRIELDGEVMTVGDSAWRSHRRVLDMRRGMLRGETVFEPADGRQASVHTRRCTSLADRHLLLQEIAVRLDNYSGRVDVDTSLDVADLNANHPHLIARPPRGAYDGVDVYRYTTRVSELDVCIAARTTLAGTGDARTRWRMPAAIGETLRFHRFIAVYTSRDVEDPESAAVEHLRGVGAFEDAVSAHEGRWRQRWQRADLTVGGSPAAEQALRFHAYHLSSAADRDPQVSVGGRALTGRAYEGHVFWDVEIFMLPFYLHTEPDIARSLLLYRWHTLGGARRRARDMGHRGACYAWESTVTGDDVTPREIRLRTADKVVPIFTGTQQIHVTADVAFGVWRYWNATHDAGFLRDAGAEILIETARFWADRCRRAGSEYHIRSVVGPDEYHHDVDDNAYTNWMARFNLEKAVWVAGYLRNEAPDAWHALGERVSLEPGELEHWADVARQLYCAGPNADGVIEQFAGFFDLADYELPKEERFRAPIDRLFDWDQINAVKLIKQADVLMLPFLFPERFSRDVLAANYRYYEPLTDHGSSLSPAVHAALAARLGLRDQALRYWQQSLSLDLNNVMGNSPLGVHPACMGATWQALVFDLLGVRCSDEDPAPARDAFERLPDKWQSVALQMMWRGRGHRLEVKR
jgi:alpha,alpha-trehalose phosphorylase